MQMLLQDACNNPPIIIAFSLPVGKGAVTVLQWGKHWGRRSFSPQTRARGRMARWIPVGGIIAR